MKEGMSGEEKVTVSLTGHSLNRIVQRFVINNLKQIERVLDEAATNGLLATEGGDLFIEYGSLLATCNHDGNGTLTVMTVLDLSDGISRRMKERTRNAGPTPWEDCEVIMPENGSEKLHLSPSSDPSIFQKQSRLKLSSHSKELENGG